MSCHLFVLTAKIISKRVVGFGGITFQPERKGIFWFDVQR